MKWIRKFPIPQGDRVFARRVTRKALEFKVFLPPEAIDVPMLPFITLKQSNDIYHGINRNRFLYALACQHDNRNTRLVGY
jgi:hypothetical protein